MKKTALSFILALAACGGGEQSTTLAGVQVWDRAEIESGTWFMDYSVASTPLAAEEVVDWSNAIEVQVLTAPEFVAAVELPDGRPLADRVRGAWEAGGEDGERAVVGTGSTTRPGGGSVVVIIPEDDEDSDDEGLEPTGTASYEPSRGLSTRVTVRWPFEDELSEEDLEILEQIHPGCI